MKDFIRVMKAFSDPNRVKIVKMLQHKVMCVCEIREALQVAQPTVSKHLKVLEDAGVVNSKKKGLWVNYHLTNGADSPYVSSMLGNLMHWLNDDSQVLRIVERLPMISRENICKNASPVRNGVFKKTGY
jgi:ArsR family transcriptional regulator